MDCAKGPSSEAHLAFPGGLRPARWGPAFAALALKLQPLCIPGVAPPRPAAGERCVGNRRSQLTAHNTTFLHFPAFVSKTTLHNKGNKRMISPDHEPVFSPFAPFEFFVVKPLDHQSPLFSPGVPRGGISRKKVPHPGIFFEETFVGVLCYKPLLINTFRE